MNNSKLLSVMTGLSAGLSAFAQQSNVQQSNTKPLNILYIMCDDHSYQTISAYDQRFIQTPNIDRIANEGVRFTNSFVANSLSGPSRACMITGKHSHKNGFTDNTFATFDGSQQTFPKLLQKAGYQTAMIGKWHLVSTPTGFDYWDILDGQGVYYNPTFYCNGDTVVRKGYATNITTDLALDWLETKRDVNKPFCLLLHHKAPHRTWMPDTCDLDLFKDVNYTVPSNFYDDYEGREAAAAQEMHILKDMDLVYDLKLADREDEIHTTRGLEAWGRNLYTKMDKDVQAKWDKHYQPIIHAFKEKFNISDLKSLEKADTKSNQTARDLAEWKYNQYMRDYLRVITSIDRNVGKVLDYLEAHDLLDNTLVVYTSDQGFYMGEHGWFDKRFMYEESFRTPLLMRLPGGRRGDVTEMVQNIDYAPTFLELAGAPIPDDIQGVSLMPLLSSDAKQNAKASKHWRKGLYYHFYEYPAEHAVKRHYGVRDSRYKLIHFYNDIDAWELYDIDSDPAEMHNIYGQPGTEKVTKRLMKLLRELEKEYDAPIKD